MSQMHAQDLQQKDFYPSRVTNKPTIFDRLDPTYYDNADYCSNLKEEDLDFYDTNGYLFIDSLFSESEISSYLDEINSLQQSYNADHTVYEPGSNHIRSFFYVHCQNTIFEKLSKDKRIIEIVQHLLGSQVYIHQSRINLKPGFRGKEFYWHSDFETWHVEDGMPRMRALSCSINLTDNHELNGPLMIVPGSHKHYVSCVGETPENHYKTSLKKQEYGVPDNQILSDLVSTYGIKSPMGNKGSVVFFDCNIMHGSNSNITPYSRTNAFFVYNSIHNRLVKPFGQIEPRPQHIACRDNFSPIVAVT